MIEYKILETDPEIKQKAYVHWRAWEEAYHGIISDEYLNDSKLEHFERIAIRKMQNIIIAKDDTNVIGFVDYGKCRDAETDEIKSGEIYALYILKEYYDQKVGYRLLSAAIQQMKEYNNICVWVLKDNVRAIKFYKRFGFVETSSEKFLDLKGKVTEVKMKYSNFEQ